MRTIFLILLMLINSAIQATVYHVAASGGDFANLTDVNAYTFVAGDQILFNKGETFYGSLVVTHSGISGNPITYGAYGTGTNPIISGFTDATGFSGGEVTSIWESNAITTDITSCNMVVINGVITPMGRYPNTGYLTFQSHSGSTSITSSSLSGTPNWTGAELVVRIELYVLDRRTISSQSSGTLNFSAATTYEPTNGYGFFIQNDARTLDAQGEWYYNPSTKKLSVYSVGSPTGVEVASLSTLVTVNAEYIILDHLTLRGANAYAVYNNTDAVSSHLTLQNCSVLFCGINGIDVKYIANCTIDGCTVSGINNNGIYIRESCDNAIIRNSTIKDMALIPGAGLSSSGTYTAISQRPNDGLLIEYNNIKNVGYNGISFFGSNSLIQYNVIDGFGVIMDDCGGIYTYGKNLYGAGGGTEFTNNKILNNIILNGLGGFDGTYQSESHTSGIYMDQNANHVEISGNTVANCGNKGAFLYNVHDINMHNNTFYNNNEQVGILQNSTEWYSENSTLTYNIYFSKTAFQPTLHYHDQIIADAGTIPSSDYNYYVRPINNDDYITVTEISTDDRMYLSDWRTFSSQDTHSISTLTTVTDTASINFIYNTTGVSKNYTLSATMVDAANTSYSGITSLLPWKSLVLIGAGSITEVQIVSSKKIAMFGPSTERKAITNGHKKVLKF